MLDAYLMSAKRSRDTRRGFEGLRNIGKTTVSLIGSMQKTAYSTFKVLVR
jgi:hypothetical protein